MAAISKKAKASEAKSPKGIKSKRPKGAQSSVALPWSTNCRAKEEKKVKVTSTILKVKPSKLKSVLPKKESKKKPFLDTYDIPASYNTTYLTLIARDPHWIYAYWEIAPSSTEKIKVEIGEEEFGRSLYVLRMYDVTYKDFNGENANHWFDLDVGPYADNWYVNIWDDNVTYCGEIGMRTSQGRFFALARSNFVTTPRINSSGRSDLVWMEVKKELEEKPKIFVETQPQVSSASSGARVGRKIFLTDDDIRAYYSRLFPILSRVISARREKGLGKISIKGSDIYFKDFLSTASGFRKKIMLGSSEELILKGGASEFAKSGASERKKKEKRFFFDIGCELIVYGRTEPDAELWLGDKRIRLREDGTFTLRFALGDGKIPLEFVARSKDKVQKRSIKTSVERARTTT